MPTPIPSRDVAIGPQIRRLRRERQLTQAALAEQLQISPTYLSLIEGGSRRVTVSLLVRLHQVLGLNLADFAQDHQGQLLADLMEAFGDAATGEHDITNHDLRDLVSTLPHVGEAVRALHGHILRLRSEVDSGDAAAPAEDDPLLGLSGVGFSHQAYEAFEDVLRQAQNHFADLEKAAAAIRRRAGWAEEDVPTVAALAEFLRAQYGVTARQSGLGEGGDASLVDSFRTITAPEIVLPHALPQQRFLLAQRLAIEEARAVIDMVVAELAAGDSRLAALLLQACTKYTAAAILMPYLRVLELARQTRYDIDRLAMAFQCSIEQIAHRLTSLNDPAQPGIPLHFLRIDPAGNIIKRLSLSGLPLPRYGTGCPRWLPFRCGWMAGGGEGWQGEYHRFSPHESYLMVATRLSKTVTAGHQGETAHYVLCLGARAEHASSFVYADAGIRTIDVGITCRICARVDCAQRATPQYGTHAGWWIQNP